ncbi:unnamed protein product [Commensalibacter papalotli (ex Botero et al. 2024)]|uniref:Uncharacterized protein n=2 Tax=Commensalibacter papalotli (ex Botero et al. 2024) TaxID=2972766 RepID=A0ABN8W9S1_9PROT|nr:unnamed protein product [Commensalibacter papalotli (ex Botero et al. 2024)]
MLSRYFLFSAHKEYQMSSNQKNTTSLKLKLCASALLLVTPIIGLTACSHDDPKTFAPLTYDYLTPIFLNVSQMDVQNLSQNQQYNRDVTNLSPILPATALQNMANTRFQARGSSGKGVFTINRASLQEQGHNGIYGQMDATLSIYNNNNQKVASVQASVNHTYDIDSSKGAASSKGNLYDATQKLMQDMNVELEFQIRKHLGNWIVDATGTPVSGGIQTQDLGKPGAVTAPTKATPNSTNKNNSTTPSSSNDDEDLSAVFPGGKPDSVKASEKLQYSPEKAKVNQLPTGSLGTLPASAVPDKY